MPSLQYLFPPINLGDIPAGVALTDSPNTFTALNTFTGGISGAVSSVALSVPSIMSVAGSPITSTGTFVISLATQVQKTFFCGPVSGANAAPTFRTIALGDLPSGIILAAGASQSITGTLTLSPTATSGGDGPILFSVVGPAHTALTASSEVTDIDFLLNRTVQFATGALTTQRAFLVRQPTYGFVGASTLTTACTMEILGSPVAGTNATITNKISLRVLAGQSTGVPLVVKGASSQSADYLKVVTSADTIVFGVGSSGQLKISSANIDPVDTGSTVVGNFPVYDSDGVLIGYAALYQDLVP